MNEEKEFQKVIRKINHARKKEGKPPIQYAIDFGETVHISNDCREKFLDRVKKWKESRMELDEGGRMRAQVGEPVRRNRKLAVERLNRIVNSE